MNDYYLVSERIARYLQKQQLQTGTIYDAVNRATTAHSQYALTFFALAALIIGHRDEQDGLLKSSQSALEYFLELPWRKRGCYEFNNLASLLIYERMTSMDVALPKNLLRVLENYISQAGYQAYPGSGTSNNWFAIRAACHLLKARIFQVDAERVEAESLIRNQILQWQLDDGFFYDYPDRVNAREYATPLAYHAKTCAMLCLCYELNCDPNILKAIVKGLSALGEFIAPGGEAFYYGRSNNAIFGYASAIFAYEKAACFIAESEGHKSQQFRHYAEQLLGFLEFWQQEDGHISVVTNSQEEAKVGWDVYTHNVVYNAYTAALLALISENENETQECQPAEVFDGKVPVYHARDAGLLRIHNNNFFLALSTRGQSLVRGSILFADLRYHGMNVLTLKYKGETVLPPPPLMWNLENRNDLDLVDPRFCGFQPFLSINRTARGEQLAAVRVYEDIHVSKQDKAVAIFASGHPTVYSKPNYLYEIGTKVAQRCRFGKSVFFKVAALRDLRLHYCIVCLFDEPLLLFVSLIEHDNGIKNLHFSGFSARILTDSFQVQGSKIQCAYKGLTLWLQKLLPDTGFHDLQDVTVATSRGSAHTLYQMELLAPETPVSINAMYFTSKHESIPKFDFSAISSVEISAKITTQTSLYDLSIFPKGKSFHLALHH